MEDKEKILNWLAKRELIKILALEKKVGIPANALSLALRRIQPLPDKYVPNLVKELKKYGYNPKEETEEKEAI